GVAAVGDLLVRLRSVPGHISIATFRVHGIHSDARVGVIPTLESDGTPRRHDSNGWSYSRAAHELCVPHSNSLYEPRTHQDAGRVHYRPRVSQGPGFTELGVSVQSD